MVLILNMNLYNKAYFLKRQPFIMGATSNSISDKCVIAMAIDTWCLWDITRYGIDKVKWEIAFQFVNSVALRDVAIILQIQVPNWFYRIVAWELNM